MIWFLLHFLQTPCTSQHLPFWSVESADKHNLSCPDACWDNKDTECEFHYMNINVLFIHLLYAILHLCSHTVSKNHSVAKAAAGFTPGPDSPDSVPRVRDRVIVFLPVDDRLWHSHNSALQTHRGALGDARVLQLFHKMWRLLQLFFCMCSKEGQIFVCY